MKWPLYVPLRPARWLWRKFWMWVWVLSEFLHIPLGRFAPWVFGEAIGAKETRMEQCSRCGRVMGAVNELHDLNVTGVSLVPGGGVGIEGYARPHPKWHCPPCNLSVPVQPKDKKRWETIYEHQTKKRENNE